MVHKRERVLELRHGWWPSAGVTQLERGPWVVHRGWSHKLRHLVAVGCRGCVGGWNCARLEDAFGVGLERVAWSFGVGLCWWEGNMPARTVDFR